MPTKNIFQNLFFTITKIKKGAIVLKYDQKKGIKKICRKKQVHKMMLDIKIDQK